MATNKHNGLILLAPRITEKGAFMSAQGAYVFNVAVKANKKEIGDAIRELYKVTPRQIRTATVPRKAVFTRGTNRWGKTAGGKKAYVYLKKGDTIDLA
jgi:large subunit ribosomal protein L23